MKAWFVSIPEEWGELVHAETRGKARIRVMSEFGLDMEDFVYIHVQRAKKLDDTPINFQSSIDAGFPWVDEDGAPLKEEDYFCICKCDICKGKPDEQA